MRSKIAILLLASALGGCATAGKEGNPDRGMAAINVPVVARTEYVFDAAASNGSLLAGESARLNAWFAGLDLGYGDSIYVDGLYAGAARFDVARVAGTYGMMVSTSAPVTTGAVPPGMVRVIVSRTRASVPGCPNWNIRSQPNYDNRMMSNMGCGVNANLAAMVANPEDLIHGREGSGVGDTLTSSKAVDAYRKAEPTGNKGLLKIDTKKGN
ncbi:CpaD family pilus assembly protein [Sphingomonas sp.]|uniref:CpaD family pilus assembly protein n=1 Tax=Sphingomonas sp. TaxID=28214 RepID=UPI00286B07A7|nr:CpaD family pilus assembly protein [Sphingomonas sp.]